MANISDTPSSSEASFASIQQVAGDTGPNNCRQLFSVPIEVIIDEIAKRNSASANNNVHPLWKSELIWTGFAKFTIDVNMNKMPNQQWLSLFIRRHSGYNTDNNVEIDTFVTYKATIIRNSSPINLSFYAHDAESNNDTKNGFTNFIPVDNLNPKYPISVQIDAQCNQHLPPEVLASPVSMFERAYNRRAESGQDTLRCEVMNNEQYGYVIACTENIFVLLL